MGSLTITEVPRCTRAETCDGCEVEKLKQAPDITPLKRKQLEDLCRLRTISKLPENPESAFTQWSVRQCPGGVRNQLPGDQQ